jgi:ABC-type nitrate/sulfonate/bicarbonate transport system substrate-binding protein
MARSAGQKVGPDGHKGDVHGGTKLSDRSQLQHRINLWLCLIPSLLALAAMALGSPASSQPATPLGGLSIVYVDSHMPAYIPAAFGVKLGVWQKRGLGVSYLLVNGSGQAAQVQLANRADLAITGGLSGILPIVKGLPAHWVADFTSRYDTWVMVVANNSNVHSPADMRGMRIGITSPGSLTDFLAKQVPGAIPVPLGGFSNQVAALERGTTAGFVWPNEAGFTLEEKKAGRVAFDYGSTIKPSVNELIQATDNVINSRPKALQAYLDGYFETIVYMKAHRKESIAFIANLFNQTDFVATHLFDSFVDDMSTTGDIPLANLEEAAKLARAAGIIPGIPDVKTYWNGSFVPAKPDRIKY